MRNIFLKLKPFHIILIISLIFVSFTIYLSLPSLFDYKKLQLKIEKQIESDFKIQLKNISKINYRFFPTPHLVISKSDLYFKNNSDFKISTLNNLKIFISINKLYQNRQIKIKKVFLTDSNFNFNYKSYISFLDQFNNFKNKKLNIKKSKFFFENKNNEISLISTIDNLLYFFDEKNNQKKLKIDGNLFDTKYDFKWNKNFTEDRSSNSILKFRNPNITFENYLTSGVNLKKTGNFKINFLSNNISIKYIYDKENLSFKSIDNKKQNLKLDGNIEMYPFSFEINSLLKNQKIDFLIKSVLLNYYTFRDKIHPNINGVINLKLDKLNSAFLSSGISKFSFANSKISNDKNKFVMRDIGTIELENSLFYEDKNQVFFVSDVEVDIINQKQFYRRFSIPIKNRINLKRIYATIEKNIDEDNYALSNISFNEKIQKDLNLNNINSSGKIYFDNFQKFRNIIRDSFQFN